MREYGQIQCSFWTNPDTHSLSDDAKLIAVYLLAGPHSNGLGCYRLPPGYVTEDFGWELERVNQTISELSRNGFITYCKASKYVLIPKFLRWNPISNPNVAKSRHAEFDSISKKVTFYRELCESILTYGNHLSDPFKTLLKRYSKQDPTQPNPILPNPTGAERAREPDPSADGDDTSADSDGEPAAESDYLKFKPDKTTLEHIRMRVPSWPIEKINLEIPGFLNHARTKWKPHELQNRFFKWVVRAWEYEKQNPKEHINGSNERPASTPAGRGKQALERLKQREPVEATTRGTH